MLSTKMVKSIVMMTPEEVKKDRNRKAAASLSPIFEGVVFLFDQLERFFFVSVTFYAYLLFQWMAIGQCQQIRTIQLIRTMTLIMKMKFQMMMR